MIANLTLVLDIILALILVGLVLLQHGKGADAGAAFGSGASATVFGSRGSAGALATATKWVAILWICTTLGLVYLTRHATDLERSVVDQSAPAATAAAPSTAPGATPSTAPVATPATAAVPSTAAPASPGGG